MMNGLPSRLVTNQLLEHASDVPFETDVLSLTGEQKPKTCPQKVSCNRWNRYSIKYIPCILPNW